MSGSVEQTKSEVRFALGQLSARNGHHEFETLARMLARATVTRKVLPATGPVSAGGDEGRDFETYRTELAGQTQRLGRELGMTDSDDVGFACTLQQRGLNAKILADVDEIMSDGTAVRFVVAYCEANVAIGNRKKLQREVRQKHCIHLEIFDGNAIAELLAHHATFWIAETYLHLPARALPPPPDRPGWYEADLTRWRETSEPIRAWGDFVDLSGCLRYAYGTREGREDIPFWLEQLEPLLAEDAPPSLRHAVRHQVILANHVGLGSMEPVDHLVAEVVVSALAAQDPHVVADSTVVLLLCCGAYFSGTTTFSARQIMEWNGALAAHVEQLLAATPWPGETCSLLESLAALKMQLDLNQIPVVDRRAVRRRPDLTVDEIFQAVAERGIGDDDGPHVDIPGAMHAFERLVEVLPEAPLYPIEHAGRFLNLHTPILVDHPQFERLTSFFDDCLAAVAGQDAVADRAVDRAQTLISAGRPLDALRQMHRARMSLLNGEAGRRLIEATFAIAELYLRLHLYSAAKYYGLAACALMQQDHTDMYPQGLYKAATADYRQGAWVSSTRFHRAALASQRLLAEQPYNFDMHPWLRTALFELVNTKVFADKVGDPFRALLVEAIEEAGVSGIIDHFLSGEFVPDDGQPVPLWWEDLDADEHRARITDGLGRPPFADAHAVRRIRFHCLGVTWAVEFANEQPSVVVGERLAATLQITLGYLAHMDPAFLPTKVRICVIAGAPTGSSDVADDGSLPTETRLRCVLTPIEQRDARLFTEASEQTLAAVFQVLFTVSTLQADAWSALMDTAFEDRLPDMVFPAVPYDIAFRDVIERVDPFLQVEVGEAPEIEDVAVPAPGPGLEAPTGPGPGYDLTHSHAEVQFRYETLPDRMLPTLRALRGSRQFAEIVATLRERGWLDWHILLAVHSVAKNARLVYRSSVAQDDYDGVRDLFLAPEPEGDPVPLRFFSIDAIEHALDVTMPASATTMWKIALRPKSLDIRAIRQLLVARYGWSVDDVPHDDSFAPR